MRRELILANALLGLVVAAAGVAFGRMRATDLLFGAAIALVLTWLAAERVVAMAVAQAGRAQERARRAMDREIAAMNENLRLRQDLKTPSTVRSVQTPTAIAPATLRSGT